MLALRQAQCKPLVLMKHWYVYILLCDQKMFYVGITNDIINRFTDHINNRSFFTKKFSDLKFVYAENYPNKYKAAKREKQLKGWSHTKKQLLVGSKLGYNVCTELVEALLGEDENLVSLLRA